MTQKTLTRIPARGQTGFRKNGGKEKARLISAVPAIIQAPPPLLELHLHLLNGATRTFVEDDPARVRQIIQQVSHCVFSQPALILRGQDQITAYPGSALAGLSFLMDPLPEELLSLDPFPCLEITQEEYQSERRAAEGSAEEQLFLMLCEVEMVGGRRLWFTTPVSQALDGFRERQVLHNAFSLPSFLCRCLGGGISLWNRAQMVSCSFLPKPDVSWNAWPAK